jgi:hypothetical protein
MKPTTATSAGPTTSSRFAHLGDGQYGMLARAWAPYMHGERTIKVFWILCSHVRPDSTCWPSRATIAEECGIHPSHVAPALRSLEALGAISTVPGVGRRVSRFRLLPPPYREVSDSDTSQAESGTRDVSDSDTSDVSSSDTSPVSKTDASNISESDTRNRPRNIPSNISINRPDDAHKKNETTAVEKRNDDRLRSLPKPAKPTQPLNAEALARAHAIRSGAMHAPK